MNLMSIIDFVKEIVALPSCFSPQLKLPPQLRSVIWVFHDLSEEIEHLAIDRAVQFGGEIRE